MTIVPTITANRWQSQVKLRPIWTSCSFNSTTQPSQRMPVFYLWFSWALDQEGIQWLWTEWDLGKKKAFLKLLSFVTYAFKDNVTNACDQECNKTGITGRSFVPRTHQSWSWDVAWTPKHDMLTCLAQAPSPCSGLTSRARPEQLLHLHQTHTLSTASLSVALMIAKLWFRFLYGLMNLT